MVYGFAKQSGGHVKIYSELGFGTTVKLYLPRSVEEEQIVAPLAVQPAVGGTETILVAEDDAGVRETVVEMLGELGYRVLKANDAASALAIVTSGIPIDLLFTDVVMPGTLRSPELARKARECLPELAVLFTSGYTENAIVHGGRLDAGVELLGKPYTRAALAQKVRHVLSNRKQRGASAAALSAMHATHQPAGAGGVRALRIMLVEDDAALRGTTAELLQLLGHTVEQAGDAETALGMAFLASADVLMTDLELPGMAGDEFAAAARRLAPALGVVFASGRSSNVDLKGAVRLLKPYDIEALQAALRQAPRAAV
jgi:CheY-like chemotaxis protein